MYTLAICIILIFVQTYLADFSIVSVAFNSFHLELGVMSPYSCLSFSAPLIYEWFGFKDSAGI